MKTVTLAGLIIMFVIASCKADIPTSEEKSRVAVTTTKESTPETKYESKLADTIHAGSIKAYSKIGLTPSSKVKLYRLPENPEGLPWDDELTPTIQIDEKYINLPWDDKLALAIQIAEKYNCMPNTIEQQAHLSSEEKAAIEELWFMARVLANIYADDALRLVNHNCPTVRMYALMALRSWGQEHFSQAMIKNIPKLHQMNVCHHDKTRSIDGIDRSREWMKSVIKELHEVANSPSPTLLKDPVLFKEIVAKSTEYAKKYAQFPDSYIPLDATTPAYPRCRIFKSEEGTTEYYLELSCFLNDKSGLQNKLVLFFPMDQDLVFFPALPFSDKFCRNLTQEEQAIFYPDPKPYMPDE